MNRLLAATALLTMSVGVLQMCEPSSKGGDRLAAHDAAAEDMRLARRAISVVHVALAELVLSELSDDEQGFRIELTNMDVRQVGEECCAVSLVWTLRDQAGKKLGTVHQSNTVPVEILIDPGHREWRAAAVSAAAGLRKLMKSKKTET